MSGQETVSALWRDALGTEMFDGTSRFGRGRTLWSQGKVSDVRVEPGEIAGRLPAPSHSEAAEAGYRAQLGVSLLTADEQLAFLDRCSDTPALAVALLTGELPLEAVTGGEPPLLPDSGSVTSDCTCDAWTEVCEHVVAVAFEFADLLAVDPFALLLIRGIGRDELVEQLRDHRATAVAHQGEPREADPGVPAAGSYRSSSGALPAMPAVPTRAGSPRGWPIAAPVDSGVTGSALTALVADAARRAVALLNGDGGSGLGLSEEADLARRSADAEGLVELARRTGRAEEELERWALAWSHGGSEAHEVIDLRWDPDPATVETARRAMIEAGGASTRCRIGRNHVTSGITQLRLHPSMRWWRFVADERLGWIADGGGFEDPSDCLEDFGVQNEGEPSD